MARIEKTVFISYRRKDISWALAVYQYLTSQKYDVFFDFSSLSSGDFEQVIVSNIRARAHFILILTPTALDRCNQLGDWLRREIEIAIDEKRNIIPLFFDGFNFGSPTVAKMLTGKLANINRYNGLEVPPGYFMEAMERLRSRYINVPLNAVLHPITTEVRKVVIEEQFAADKALEQKKVVIDELVRSAEEKFTETGQIRDRKVSDSHPLLKRERGERDVKLNIRVYRIGMGMFLIVALALFGFYLWKQYFNLGVGSSMVASKDGMVLLYVPAGEFTMGNDTNSYYERPAHKVTIDAFWIDQTEVTNSMFATFVNQTNHRTYAEEMGKSWIYQEGSWVQVNEADWLHPYGPASGISNFMNNPVVHVSWKDALAYCVWADRRLPTEAEWEKSASWNERKQQKSIYPWGDTIDCLWANYSGVDGFCVGNVTPVGSYVNGQSPYEAFDMAGNVWEWVSSQYQLYPYSITDGREELSVSANRVLRGGSWLNDDFAVRSASRNQNNPAYSSNSIGFRCAMSASE